jgi:hypothetical protein
MTRQTSQLPLSCISVLQDYDVYVAEKQPLPAGEEKHVISVFVADEAGLINRVAGVFARRGVFSTTAAEVLLRLQGNSSGAAVAAAMLSAVQCMVQLDFCGTCQQPGYLKLSWPVC